MDSPCHWNSSQATLRGNRRRPDGRTPVWLVTSARADFAPAPLGGPQLMLPRRYQSAKTPSRCGICWKAAAVRTTWCARRAQPAPAGRRPALASGSRRGLSWPSRCPAPFQPPSPEKPLQGGCLCGAVRYEITAPFLSAGYCHCTHCQRRTGTGSSANGRVPQAGFRLLSGTGAAEAVQAPDGRAEAVLHGVRVGALQRRTAERPRGRRAPRHARRRSRDPAPVPAVRGLGGGWEPIPDDGLERHPGARS